MEEDKYLYKEFINGNNKAFEQLVMKYKTNIIYFITRYVKNVESAEDIFQDVIVYMLEKKERYNFKYSLKTYMYMIAKSKSLDYIKKKKYMENIDEQEFCQEDLLEEIILNKYRKSEIKKAINKLQVDYQIVIYLTQIEELSYKETAKIMDKTERQIKTLVYNAKKKLKKLFIEEKLVEINGKKIIKLFMMFIILIVMFTGIGYATVKIYKKITGKANLVPVYTGQMGNNDMNTIWGGNFQIAWNEFMENVLGEKIKFTDNDSEMVRELNRKIFTKNMISKDGYYLKIGKTSPNLKNEIIKDTNEKFSLENIEELNKINFEERDGSYTIYSLLLKRIGFLIPFDRISDQRFGNSIENVKYFGINNASDESLNENLTVLFYNEKEYAVKLFTKGNDEIILYRTDSNDSFDTIYQQILDNSKIFAGEKTFKISDELRIPYIEIDTLINYDELCGHFIEEENDVYIANALQNIHFFLNENGCNLTSEANIKVERNFEVSNSRCFNYTDSFVIFIKEKEAELPYFALKVNNIEILVSAEE